MRSGSGRVRQRPSSIGTTGTTWPAVLDGIGAAYVAYQPDLCVAGAVDTVRAFFDAATKAGVRKIRNTPLTDGVQRALGRGPKKFSDYVERTVVSGVWGAN
jgi:hypothetical protein